MPFSPADARSSSQVAPAIAAPPPRGARHRAEPAGASDCLDLADAALAEGIDDPARVRGAHGSDVIGVQPLGDLLQPHVQRLLADAAQDVWFVGRLATYRYYNMDQIVGQALAAFTKIDASLPPEAANDDAEALRRAAAGD